MAFCQSCGSQIADQAVMCPNCGHMQQAASGQAFGMQSAARRTEGTAIASLILGIAGLVVCPVICSVLALVFGSQAKGRISNDPSLEGAGMARAGVVLGWIGIGLGALWAILIAAIALSSNSNALVAF